MPDWVELFFRDYAAAFRAKESRGLLAKFCLPLTFLTKRGPVAFADEVSLAANLAALIRRYEQIGAVAWHYTIGDVRAIGAGIHLVELEWRFCNADDELLFACATSYVLAGEAQAEAKVMAIIAHNENEEYAQALARRRGD